MRKSWLYLRRYGLTLIEAYRQDYSNASFAVIGDDRPLEIRISGLVTGHVEAPAVTKIIHPELGGERQNAMQRLHQDLPPFLPLVAFKDKFHFAFLFDNFVWSTYGHPWLHLSAEGKLGTLSFQTCQALSMRTFAKHHTQPDIEAEGALHYGKAVTSLRERLTQTDSEELAGLLVPILILLLHASFSGARAESESHLNGLMTVLHLCGPEAFRKPLLRDAFSSCRSMLAIIYMSTSKRSFLEEERWRTGPWEYGKIPKSNQDQLVDVFIMLPGLREDFVTLDDLDPEEALLQRQDLCSKIKKHLRTVFVWRAKWDAANFNAAYEKSRKPATPQNPKCYPIGAEKLLWYKTLGTAAEHSLFNAVYLCLLGLLESLEPAHAVEAYLEKLAATTTVIYSSHSPRLPPSPRQSVSLTLGEGLTMRGPATQIVRAFEFMLIRMQSQYSRESALYWLFPLGIAGKVLEDESKWKEWVLEMLSVSQGRRGYGAYGSLLALGQLAVKPGKDSERGLAKFGLPNVKDP